MSYTRTYRLDLVDSRTGASLAHYPDAQRYDAQREAIRLSLDLSGGQNCTRVRVSAVPMTTQSAGNN